MASDWSPHYSADLWLAGVWLYVPRIVYTPTRDTHYGSLQCHGVTGLGSGAPCVYIILPPGLAPAPPSCSAANITHSSFQVIKREKWGAICSIWSVEICSIWNDQIWGNCTDCYGLHYTHSWPDCTLWHWHNSVPMPRSSAQVRPVRIRTRNSWLRSLHSNTQGSEIN